MENGLNKSKEDPRTVERKISCIVLPASQTPFSSASPSPLSRCRPVPSPFWLVGFG